MTRNEQALYVTALGREAGVVRRDRAGVNKRIGRFMVDVAYRACGPELECYALGFDKGTFVQGRGYTSYREKPLAVCQTRHLHGCPTAWICPAPCSTAHAAGAPPTCGRCGAAKGPRA